MFSTSSESDSNGPWVTRIYKFLKNQHLKNILFAMRIFKRFVCFTLEVVAGKETGSLRSGHERTVNHFVPRLKEEEVTRLVISQLTGVLHVILNFKVEVDLPF